MKFIQHKILYKLINQSIRTILNAMRTRRPITTTTTTTPFPQQQQQHQSTALLAKTAKITTPLPILMSTAIYEKKFTQKHRLQQIMDKSNSDEDESQPSFMSLNIQQNSDEKQQKSEELEHDDSDDMTSESAERTREFKKNVENLDKNLGLDTLATSVEENQNEYHTADEQQEPEDVDNNAGEMEATENGIKFVENKNPAANLPEVDERVKQISHKIEKLVSSEQMFPLQHHPHAHFIHQDNNNDADDDDLNRQSFLSLTDLIRTLRPNDKQIIPQIDSDYSNAMRVLGENSGPLIKNDEPTRGAGVNFREI